jgi:hypothetical protein
MIVELNKEDLCNLLGGTSPSYGLMDKISKMGLGYYVGGFSDEWKWTLRNADSYSKEELWDLYKEITGKEE